MILYDTKYLQLKSTKTKNDGDWVYAHRPNASNVVVILPIINSEQVLFLIEQRPPLNAENIAKYSIGLPAGLVGDVRENESTIDAIKAELLEETGLIPDEIKIKAKKVASSPGCISETITIAIARIKNYKISSPPIDDGGVIIDRKLVKIKDIFKWLKQKESEGYALTAQTLAALLYLFEKEEI